MKNRTPQSIIIKLGILIFVVASCQNKMKEKKFNWSTAASTPTNYPALIFAGNLIIGSDLKGGYNYLPFDEVLNPEDGLASNLNSTTNSVYGVVPQTLDITWMSYTENKSYSGIFKLDSERIKELMINGSNRIFDDKETKKIGVVTDYDFVINAGVIPGGIVVLYVFSPSNTTLVGRYQAHEDKNVNWKTAFEQMKDNSEMDEYVTDMVSRYPEEIKDQIAQGTIPFGYWDTLFRTYKFTPVVANEDKVEAISLNYINGEHESIFLAITNNVIPVKERAAPKKMNIVWHDKNNRRMESNVYFEEKKVKTLFENTKPNLPMQFVIEIDRNTKPRETKGISIKLKIADKVIDLIETISSQETFTKPPEY